jgi:hypothetical protein
MTTLNDKHQKLYFVIWGVGCFGFILIIIVTFDVIRLLFSEQPVLWSREIVGFGLGLACYLTSYFLLKKIS